MIVVVVVADMEKKILLTRDRGVCVCKIIIYLGRASTADEDFDCCGGDDVEWLGLKGWKDGGGAAV